MKDKFENYVLAKFRVKIKSLAEEARIIRKEERRCSSVPWIAGSLRDHRRTAVRHEQRHTLLAYAYVRDVPYNVVESMSTKREPDLDAVVRIIKSLRRDAPPNDAVRAWLFHQGKLEMTA